MWQLVNEEKQSLKDWTWSQIIKISLTEEVLKEVDARRYLEKQIKHGLLLGTFYIETYDENTVLGEQKMDLYEWIKQQVEQNDIKEGSMMINTVDGCMYIRNNGEWVKGSYIRSKEVV
jgi:hypothetical protein